MFRKGTVDHVLGRKLIMYREGTNHVQGRSCRSCIGKETDHVKGRDFIMVREGNDFLLERELLIYV